MTQSGEVVSHRAHNPGTGGANPSSATKHGVFMIAIDVTMFPVGTDANVGQDYTMPFVNKEYKAIFAFFQDCVDQSLILNVIEHEEFFNSTVTTYFSPNMEKAQLFEQKFQDLTAEFSMRKFWNQSELDTTTAFREVDFDLVWNTFELVNQEFLEIWGFPIET
jgi:hypothetical protein